ncbi:MAG: 30S ribosomal protein S17 [Desulfobacterales bacterium]|nr:30S ribosomal protein S17 [Desulfobacterales bacterium]
MDAVKKRVNKRQVVGTVVSDKMDKTVIVQVERMIKYPLYHKYIKRRSRFSSHDEGNTCQIGDRVLITESRPISRTKKWRVSKILKKVV